MLLKTSIDHGCSYVPKSKTLGSWCSGSNEQVEKKLNPQLPIEATLAGVKNSGFHFFVVFASDAKDLTERRGLVEMSSAGRTETPATEDPRGTPETGSISTSTAAWTLGTCHSLNGTIKLEKLMRNRAKEIST